MTLNASPYVSRVISDNLIAGFDDPVQDSQTVFRSVLKVMSEPGTISRLNPIESAPESINKSCWQVALCLFDADTKIWLSPALKQCVSLVSNLKFHCQSTITETPIEADFALCNADEVPSLTDFNWGSSEYPDRSTTLLLQVPALSEEPFWSLNGPGIKTQKGLRIAGLPDQFRSELMQSRQRFPLGIDAIFCCDDRLAALPRTTQITEELR